MQENPMFHVDDNILMNMNILKASSENKVKKFIFISSNTVYPVSKKAMNVKKMSIIRYFDKYFNVGWMKIFSEKLCQMYKNKMNILIVRPGKYLWSS
jgi:nucleoside-diphosphate-sugar epimerase